MGGFKPQKRIGTFSAMFDFHILSNLCLKYSLAIRPDIAGHVRLLRVEIRCPPFQDICPPFQIQWLFILYYFYCNKKHYMTKNTHKLVAKYVLYDYVYPLK